MVHVTLEPVRGSALPDAFAGLAAEAAAEGHRIPARVVREWAEGLRFDRPGEALLAAWDGAVPAGRVLAAIGGLTHDPAWPSALRMRRFYVRPGYRRRGLARRMALALLATAEGRTVLVHAGTPDAPAFWESLGFVRDGRTGLHRLPSAPSFPGEERIP